MAWLDKLTAAATAVVHFPPKIPINPKVITAHKPYSQTAGLRKQTPLNFAKPSDKTARYQSHITFKAESIA
jgi:hypothetical protein